MIEDNFLSAKQQKLLGKKQEETVAYLNRVLEKRIPVNLKGLKFQRTLNAQSPDEPKFERKYYLQSVAAHQGNNDFITDIEVTIKEFRIATTKVTKMDKSYSVKMPTQVAKQQEVNTGTAKGQTPTTEAIENVKRGMEYLKENHPVAAKTVQTANRGLMYYSKGIFNNSIFQNSALNKLFTPMLLQGFRK